MSGSAAERQAPAANDAAMETAALVLRWCPYQARALALAMYERAAWQYNDSQTELWLRVVGLLPAD